MNNMNKPANPERMIAELIEHGDINKALEILDNTAASKAYVIIRDNIKPKHLSAIRNSGFENYKLFQDIKLRAKQSWDYDHSMATIADVNRACANVYTLVLNIMKQYNDSSNDELIKIHNAINKIEEKLGIDVSDWADSDNSTGGGNNNDHNNVQGVKEDI